ncbi:MAG: divalent metal cation transporter, partial [Puniceicoccales bacterium]
MHQVVIVLSAVVASVIVLTLVKNLLQLLSFAAIISFLTSPVLAWINLKVMRGDNVPAKDRPGPILMTLSWMGLAFFIVMGVGFICAQFFIK